MRKIYKLNQRKTSATFTLTANGGKVVVGYKFEHGNPIANVPARLALSNQFDQDLLEKSPIFKRHIVVLERTIKDNEVQKPPEKHYTPVKEVTNVTQAIDYIANTYTVKVKNTKQALDFAHKNGFDFPNLKVKE